MYVLDRLLALQLGRPIAIHEADFDVKLPYRTEVTFDIDNHRAIFKEGDTEKVSLMDYFLHVIQFSRVLGQVINQLYQPTQADPSPDGMLLSMVSLDRDLLHWKADLPRHLRFDLGHTFEKSVTFKRQVGNRIHFIISC